MSWPIHCDEREGVRMILCSCTLTTDHDIEQALVELLNRPDAMVPTPGLVFRHMKRKMICGSCVRLAVSVIYQKVEKLESLGLICPWASEAARKRLELLTRRQRRMASHRSVGHGTARAGMHVSTGKAYAKDAGIK